MTMGKLNPEAIKFFSEIVEDCNRLAQRKPLSVPRKRLQAILAAHEQGHMSRADFLEAILLELRTSLGEMSPKLPSILQPQSQQIIASIDATEKLLKRLKLTHFT